MSARNILMSAAGSAGDKLYVDDVFSAFTYTGNGAAQTINNGIDLAGKGGMVWIKGRSASWSNWLQDTARGIGNAICSNTTDPSGAYNYVTATSSTGFSLEALTQVSQSTTTYASWTFRKALKFFDVVTFIAGSNTNRRISHSLGISPGMVFLKSTTIIDNWSVYHLTQGRGPIGSLNLTDAFYTGSNRWGSSDPTATDFGVNESALCTPGATYVAYLFAHDTSADGIIQCGSFVSTGTGQQINLGWEAQWILYKNRNAVSDWNVLDISRGFSHSQTQGLRPNTSAAEDTIGGNYVAPNPLGFTLLGSAGGLFVAGNEFIYLAIRRPNKPPTTGTQVYNAIARTGTGAAATVTGVGFAPDLVLAKCRTNPKANLAIDRLRGVQKNLIPDQTVAEVTDPTVTSFNMDGVTVGTDPTYAGINGLVDFPYINHFFKRAPGFFDIVAYTGTGVAKTVAHGLGVVPELMIVKGRSGVNNWNVYCSTLGNTSGYPNFTEINGTFGTYNGHVSMFSAVPNATEFSVGTSAQVNTSAATYVTYLFATKAGISKVFSFTGNGGTQNIDCGFTTGARFVLIKASSTTGNWNLGDSTRGIVAAADPFLCLNTTAAEVISDDWLDPYAQGFTVNETASAHANTNGVTYIGIAYA